MAVARKQRGKRLGKQRVVRNTMWGGRFASGPDAIMERINVSIDFDWHLYRQDIAASKAHAEMLAKQGIIAADDARKIAHGLDTILSEIGSGKFKFNRALEDIHMNVESRLSGLIGPAAGPITSASRDSTFIWMSSSARLKRNLPDSISDRIVSRP